MNTDIQAEKKKTIFSGMQPSGNITLGNYLGALRNWIKLQDEYNCLFCIVDLHALTVRQNPAELRKRSREVLMQYIAAGLNPDKNIIYYQSHVSAHAELAWILNCFTYMGELNRMTQFKEKAEKHKDNINAGLYTYPVLQVADILLYQADLVPVGEDQRQHIELTRDVAIRFNNTYGEVFTLPDIYVPKIGSKIMSLQDPESKMSKSDENVNGTIFLLDSDKDIVKKVKRSVTDSENRVAYRDEQPGVKNLLTIYSKLSDYSIEELVEKYASKGYGALKTDLAELLVETIRPIREKHNEYMDNLDYLASIYKKGAEKASIVAERTMTKVRESIGLV